MAGIRLLSLNDVKLVGRLTRDPELRFTTQGTPVCHFRLAVGRRYRDKNSGEWKDDVSFISCVVWRESAERCGARLKKGSPVFVEGRLKSRDWQTKEGQKRTEIEVDVQRVQFLESLGEAAESDASASDESAEPSSAVGVGSTQEFSGGASGQTNNDDEVPF